jgi:hypothetical protein
MNSSFYWGLYIENKHLLRAVHFKMFLRTNFSLIETEFLHCIFYADDNHI